MNWIPVKTRAGQTCVRTTMGLTLSLMLLACTTSAQQPQSAEQTPSAPPRVESYASLQLKYTTQQREMNDVQTDLRNMLVKARIYGVASRGVISIWGTQDEIELARKIVAEMDQPAKAYTLKFTITETDGGKQTGVQHLSMVSMPGTKATMKQGARMPIVTGSYKEGSSGDDTEVQYLDVGLNIEASLDGNSVHVKVEQTSPAAEPSGLGTKDPVIRQSVLDTTTRIVVDKPVILGTLDVPGTSRHQEVAMTAEILP